MFVITFRVPPEVFFYFFFNIFSIYFLNASEKIPGETSGTISAQISGGVPGDIADGIAAAIPKKKSLVRISTGLPKDIVHGISLGSIFGGISEKFLKKLSKKFPKCSMEELLS